MPTRFYTHRARTRVRLNQPKQLFHFMCWQMWTSTPSLFLFIIGCFPTQTRLAFVVSQLVSFLFAALLNLPKEFSERSTEVVEDLRPQTVARTKTAGLLGTTWVLESALVYYVSAWSRTGFIWTTSVLSILYTLGLIVCVQTLVSVLLRALENMTARAWRTTLLWCSLGLFETGFILFGNRCSGSSLGCRELFLSVAPFMAKATFVWISGAIATCGQRGPWEFQLRA